MESLRTALIANKNSKVGFRLNVSGRDITVFQHKNNWYTMSKDRGCVNINPLIGLIYNINLQPLLNLACVVGYLQGFQLNITQDLKEEVENVYSDFYKNFHVEL